MTETPRRTRICTRPSFLEWVVTRTRRVGDQGDIAALRDVESRIEDELSRLEKMEKCSAAIRKNVDGISEEIRKAQKALDVLVRKPRSTLCALNVEVRDESAELRSPIAPPNESLSSGVLALSRDGEAA